MEKSGDEGSVGKVAVKRKIEALGQIRCIRGEQGLRIIRIFSINIFNFVNPFYP